MLRPDRDRHPDLSTQRPARRRAAFSLLAFAATLGLLASLGASPALAAEPCPNEALRTGPSANLPDCRAYEQVSPPDKNGNDALGRPGLTQSSPSGEAVTYGSLGPFPGVPGSSEYPTYLAARASGEGGWSTRGLLPQTQGSQGENPPKDARVWALTEDLSLALLDSEGSNYVYDTATESSLPFASIAPASHVKYAFAGASADDSTILFEDEIALPGTIGAQEGVPNLYEWVEGQPRLIAADAVAGPGGEFINEERAYDYYTQHTISADGSRVFYTSLAAGPGDRHVYMREGQGAPLPVSNGAAEWRAATPDGSTALYIEAGGLYRWCQRLPGGPPCEGEAGSGAPLLTQIAPPTAGVSGTLGLSDDGSYVYFVAEGALTGQNSEGNEPTQGKPNLYAWHRGETTYVATLGGNVDDTDWEGHAGESTEAAAEGQRSSRVTPGGRSVLFASNLSLTGYPNAQNNEIYRYDAPAATLSCISCNPSAQPAIASTFLARVAIPYFALPPARANGYLTRNLSAAGSRVFFETPEALLPADANTGANPNCEPHHTGCDVYEWEADGAGSCRSEARSGGCLYLISSGQPGTFSYFGDASASGDDVFFFTGQSLVAQDGDGNFDLYDARVGGGLAAQNAPPPKICEAQGCRDEGTHEPPAQAPASESFEGHEPTPAPPSCRRGFLRRHGVCVRRHRHRRHSPGTNGRHRHRAADHSRGGGR